MACAWRVPFGPLAGCVLFLPTVRLEFKLTERALIEIIIHSVLYSTFQNSNSDACWSLCQIEAAGEK